MRNAVTWRGANMKAARRKDRISCLLTEQIMLILPVDRRNGSTTSYHLNKWHYLLLTEQMVLIPPIDWTNGANTSYWLNNGANTTYWLNKWCSYLPMDWKNGAATSYWLNKWWQYLLLTEQPIPPIDWTMVLIPPYGLKKWCCYLLSTEQMVSLPPNGWTYAESTIHDWTNFSFTYDWLNKLCYVALTSYSLSKWYFFSWCATALYVTCRFTFI
jgi:hypothetical protein